MKSTTYTISEKTVYVIGKSTIDVGGCGSVGSVGEFSTHDEAVGVAMALLCANPEAQIIDHTEKQPGIETSDAEDAGIRHVAVELALRSPGVGSPDSVLDTANKYTSFILHGAEK